ncbi:non-ribosomal peptide synthetase [Candidimonas nitroreducens]|nr:non-ribosomal peptide synthetase [Candidimonas nitroreducens]
MTSAQFPSGPAMPGRTSEPSGPALRPIEDAYPLTRMQQALLVRCLAYPEQPLYMGQWWAVLEGALDTANFTAAWQAVVDRHAALRSGFHWDLKDHPFQVVHRQAKLKVLQQDWSAEADWRARLDAFLAEDRAQGFELKKPPLMRIALLRLAPQRHIVVWTRHHLTVDGWSLGILLEEAFAIYKGLCRNQPAALPPAPSFRAYVEWEKTAASAAPHWGALLAAHPIEDGASGETRLTRGASNPDIQAIERRVPQADVQRLEALARACRVTLNTLIQGAWAMVGSRLDGHDGQLFGAVETLRPPQLDQGGDSRLVGIQIRIQPVLARIDDRPLAAWLEALQATVADAREAGTLGMDELRELLGLPRDSLPFDSLVGYQNYPLDINAALEGSGLALAGSGDTTLPDMPLNLMVERHQGELSLQLMFDRHLRDAADAALRLDMLAHTLASLPDHADTPVAAIDVLPQQIRAALLADAATPAPEPAGQHGVLGAILQHAAAQPHAIAATWGEQRLSYAELAATAAAVARHLAQRGIGRGSRVGVLLERTPLAIAAIIGILHSGASYVPLDMDSPAERKAYIVEQAGLAAVLADSEGGELAGAPLVTVNEIVRGESAPAADPDAATLPAPGDEAYVIFTSGSTGRPKGVSVSHGNLAYHVAARAAAYAGRPNQVLLLSFPLIFDGSVTGIFGTLAIGGTLVLPKPIEATDPDRLAALIRSQGVTQTIMIPSQWSLLLSAGNATDFASMKMAVVAGEACPRDLVERHCARLPGVVLSNEYGPTETTVWATLEICRAGETGPVAIGRAIPGARAYVADGRNRLCPPGAAGELLIAGPGVAQGYVGRPDLSAERFIANPFHDEPGYGVVYRTGDRVVRGFDGRLRFHGRSDDQVKISGYRIELTEIAACLQELAGVREAVAIAQRASPQAPARIVAHVAGPDLPSEEAILRHAQRLLPAYMVPHGVVLHERLPRTAAGKVDRQALPQPRLRESVAEAPESGAEQAIAQIWQAVLGCGAVGRHDDFFAIGGRSLDAMQVVSRLRRDLKLGVDLIDLFEAPRLADFARRVGGRESGEAPAIRKRQRARVDLSTVSTPGQAS